jgi:hypothetical protein
LGALDRVVEYNTIEGYNIVKYVGNTFTIAFRAKVPVAGIHCVGLQNSNGDRCYVHEINFPAANTWQDCSFTVIGGLPTAGTWNYTNGVGLYVVFTHACGVGSYQTATADTWGNTTVIATANQVNDCATIGNVWALEDVRMNLGTFCPPDDASYDEDLRTCQRYFEKSYDYSVAIGTAGAVGGFASQAVSVWVLSAPQINYKVQKRVDATVTLYSQYSSNTTGVLSEYNLASAFVADRTGGIFGVMSHTANGFAAQAAAGSFTVGNMLVGHWTASARL